MNFDLFGAWSTDTPIVLPNSPLNGTCPSSTSTTATSSSLTSSSSSEDTASLEGLPISANTAVASWVLSGFRPDQIVLGVSASGRSYRVAEADAVVDGSLAVYPPFSTTSSVNGTNATTSDLGDSWWWGDLVASSTSTTNSTVTASISASTASSSSPSSASHSSPASSVSDLRKRSKTTSAGVATASSNATTSSVPSITASFTDITSPVQTTTMTFFPSTTPSAACVLPTEISTISGVFTFQGLIDAGYLDSDGDVMQCTGDDSPEIIGGWDECSETPFVYNVGTGVMVSYDDAESMELKGQFILNAGLRGFSLYEAGGDSSTGTLLTAIRHGAGFPDGESCLPVGEDDWTYAHMDQVAEIIEEAEADWETILQTEMDQMLAATATSTTTTSIIETTEYNVTATRTSTTSNATASSTSGVARRRLRWARE